ncbi:conserved Plasmodium protein, unknown function [Plasmodium malariae]|uniref:Uncharacterized protein n=1 Tax=Plasmodium malariae TaxID=5858 RepID=A0A1A8WPY4_PLAMA|nr:conserved Plasmodium protein, unknown function [Plasmodium malariae]
MIRRGKKVISIINAFSKRRVQTIIRKDEVYSADRYEELNFLENKIKDNLHKLKCLEQKKIQSDRIVYKNILKELLKEKENFVADEMIHFLYILVYNDLYYLDICSNFFSYFYDKYLFSKRYFNNVNVNSIIHVIYSYYLFENYYFLTWHKRNVHTLKNNDKNIVEETDTQTLKGVFEDSSVLTHPRLIRKDGRSGRNNSSSPNSSSPSSSSPNSSSPSSSSPNSSSPSSSSPNSSRFNSNSRSNSSRNSGSRTGGGPWEDREHTNGTSRYRDYYNNAAYRSFHIYNFFSPFINTNIDYINKNHLIKILLVLSQYVYNSTICGVAQYEDCTSKRCINSLYNDKFKNVGKILFTLIEAFVEKINIKKDIKKAYMPETINEKEIKKKKERYINLIDNSYKNFIYIDNDLNEHKLICLFFYIISNIFYPISENFFFKGGHLYIDEMSNGYTSSKSTEEAKLDQKDKDYIISLRKDASASENLRADNESIFPIVDMFTMHYNTIEIRNVFYKNTGSEKTSIENFIIYKNNILKNMKKNVYLDSIYSLEVHYKLIFFKAIYSLNFFKSPFLKYVYLIHHYQKYNSIDYFDYCERLHFHNDQNVHIEIGNADGQSETRNVEMNQSNIYKEDIKEASDIEDIKYDRITEKTREQWLRNKMKNISKRGYIFNNEYINLLNDIDCSIRNNSTEQTINTLLHMHLLRFMDNHFIILFISKLCNSTDKLRNEHKKKINIIITSLLTFLSSHINSPNLSFQKKAKCSINIFNHVYYNNNVYIKHLKKLYDFVLLMYNKKVFKRKRKELLSWTNYKCL